MEPQKPAEGISAQQQFPDSKWYKIDCACHHPDHEVTMEIEVDDLEICVHWYVETKTAWWKDHCQRHFDWLPYNVKYYINRVINSVILVYHGVVHGYVKQDAYLSLTRQSALNLSNVLVTAIDDLDEIRAKRLAEIKAETDEDK